MFGGLPEVPMGLAPEEFSGQGASNEYRADTYFRTYYGRIIMPVAGEAGKDEPPEVIDLHAPYTVQEIKWTAERMGDQPQTPKVDTGDKNDTILETLIGGVIPTDLMGSKKVWRLSGQNIYVSGRPQKPGDPIILGRNPIGDGDAAENTHPGSKQKTLLGRGRPSPDPFGNNIAKLRQGGGSQNE